MPSPSYELVLVARVPQRIGPPALIDVDRVEWLSLSWGETLSRPPTLDATVKITTLSGAVRQRLRPNPGPQPTELWLHRNGRLVFAGPLMTWSATADVLTLRSVGLLGYLGYMAVITDLTYAQVDQHLIAKALVDHHQGLTYGHFGIDTGAVTPSGVLRDASYPRDELHHIGQRVEELGKRQGGFDVEVDPTTRRLQLWCPLKGVDRSAGDDAVVFDTRNITDTTVSCSMAPGDVASDALGVGTGSDTYKVFATAFDVELRAQFGRCAVTATFDGVSEPGTVFAHVQGMLDARRGPLLIPGPRVRNAPDADVSTYGVGDTVAYVLHEGLDVRGAFRLRKRTVTVEADGAENITPEFV